MTRTFTLTEFIGRKRDCNAKGNGDEVYRMVAIYDDQAERHRPLCWADRIEGAITIRDDWKPMGYRAANRRCESVYRVTLPAGSLMLRIDKTIGRHAGTERSAYVLIENPAEPGKAKWHELDVVGTRKVGDAWETIVAVGGSELALRG